MKIAEALDISPMLVMAIAAGERARGKETQKIWRKIAEQVALGVISSYAAFALFSSTSAHVPPVNSPAIHIMTNMDGMLPGSAGN